MRARKLTAALAAIPLMFAAVASPAAADNIQDSIQSDGSVTVVAGSTVPGKATIRVVHTGGDNDAGCNMDPGESPLILDILTPVGVTAAPDPLSIPNCGADYEVSFTAGEDAVSGTASVSILSRPAADDPTKTAEFANQVSIPITVTGPAPTNTKPVVELTGVTDGATYDVGTTLDPVCNISDVEDGGTTKPATVTGTLTHGLGTQTATCDHTDRGGLRADTKTATYSFVDSDGPTITHSLSTTGQQVGDWYNAPVRVTFECSDGNGSGIATCLADGETGSSKTLDEGAAQSANGTATDHAGNTATDTASGINVDMSGPDVFYDGVVAGVEGDNGWYTSPVTVRFTATDQLSGPSSQSRTVTSDADGASVVLPSPAFTDAVGNTTAGGAAQSPELQIDSQAPNAPTILLDPLANSAGWHNQDVRVSFVPAEDNGASGVADCTADAIVTAEDAGQEISGTCTDNAGNESEPATVVINLDKTAPVVSEVVAIHGTEGANGWYTSDVDVVFSATDALSGPATDTKSVAVTQEGVHQVLSPSFTDTAGNTTAAGEAGVTVKIDKTAPSEPTFTGLPESSFYFGSTVSKPTCTSEDAVSGATCAVTLDNAGDDLNAVGTHTFIATATNGAGLTSTSSFTYTVLAWTAKGFYSPVDMGGTWNTVKGGSTVPLKFEVFKGAQELSDTRSVRSFSTRPATCPGASAPADAIEFLTTGGTALRWDATAGQFIQNWQTPKKPGTCHAVTVTMQDGSSLTANFILK
jgi:hypothetical protein